jgi:hypothetical protein
MEKIDRYIYAVTRRLPENQRKDIEKELRGLIEDMLSGKTDKPEYTAQTVDQVLMELGDPVKLADQYRAKSRYLIGPDNFDTYILVVKIVIAAIAFGMTLATTIGYIVNPPDSLISVIGRYFGNLIGAFFQGFAWVTIVFAVLEYQGVAIGKEFKDNKWTPADLPELPSKETEIKPVESILGILFAVIAIIILNTADHLIGIYIFGDEGITRVIPLFSHDVFRTFLPLLNIMVALGIVKESLKLAAGKWTPTLAITNLAFNAVSFGLFVIFIRGEGLWNNAFFEYWMSLGIIPVEADPFTLWGTALTGLTIVVAFALLIDSIVNLVKGFKYQLSR